jgi:hypothetical protein
MTYDEARDHIFKVFLDVWGDKPVIWMDMYGRVNDENATWARAILKHTAGGQASLSGVDGTTMYDRTGIALFQVFTPAGRGLTEGYQFATQIANAFEDSKLDVWFRNTHITEKGVNGSFYQIDVLTDFSYNEVR